MFQMILRRNLKRGKGEEEEASSRNSGFRNEADRACEHPRIELRIKQWTHDSFLFLRLQCEMCDAQLCESRTKAEGGGEPQVTILDQEWCESPKGFMSPEAALKGGVKRL